MSDDGRNSFVKHFEWFLFILFFLYGKVYRTQWCVLKMVNPTFYVQFSLKIYFVFFFGRTFPFFVFIMLFFVCLFLSSFLPNTIGTHSHEILEKKICDVRSIHDNVRLILYTVNAYDSSGFALPLRRLTVHCVYNVRASHANRMDVCVECVHYSLPSFDSVR